MRFAGLDQRTLFEVKGPFGELGRRFLWWAASTCAPSPTFSAHANILPPCHWLLSLQPADSLPASQRPSIVASGVTLTRPFHPPSSGLHLRHIPTSGPRICPFSRHGDARQSTDHPTRLSRAWELHFTRIESLSTPSSQFRHSVSCGALAKHQIKVAHADRSKQAEACSDSRPTASRSTPAVIHELDIGCERPYLPPLCVSQHPRPSPHLGM